MTRLVFSWVNVKVEQLDQFSFSCCNTDQASLITSCILVKSVNRWKPEEHQSPQWWSSITSLLVVWGHSEQQVGGFNLAGYHPKFFKLKKLPVIMYTSSVVLLFGTLSNLLTVHTVRLGCLYFFTVWMVMIHFSESVAILFCCYSGTIFFNVCE